MATKKTEANFEKNLEALEALVAKMEEGGMQLEELMRSYEAGVKLAQSLKLELDAAQQKLLILKNGALEEAPGDDELS